LSALFDLPFGRCHGAVAICHRKIWASFSVRVLAALPAVHVKNVHYVLCPCVQTQAEQCLNDDELRLLGSLLQEHAAVMYLPAADGSETEELRINYDGFNSVSAAASFVCQQLCYWHASISLLAVAAARLQIGSLVAAVSQHMNHLPSAGNAWLASVLSYTCCLAGWPQGPGAPRYQHSCCDAFHTARAVPAL
jgi:hypothetical protein